MIELNSVHAICKQNSQALMMAQETSSARRQDLIYLLSSRSGSIYKEHMNLTSSLSFHIYNYKSARKIQVKQMKDPCSVFMTSHRVFKNIYQFYQSLKIFKLQCCLMLVLLQLIKHAVILSHWSPLKPSKHF